jgi:AcrR family transcriptional regulator
VAGIDPPYDEQQRAMPNGDRRRGGLSVSELGDNPDQPRNRPPQSSIRLEAMDVIVPCLASSWPSSTLTDHHTVMQIATTVVGRIDVKAASCGDGRRYLFGWSRSVVSSRGDRASAAASTRARIVESAIELFARGGYAGTSVLAIAERAGISDAGVLYHFSTKRDLFVAVVDVFADLQADTLEELLAPGGFAAIRNLAGWGAVMEESPDLLAVQIVLSAESIAPEAELHSYWASRHAALLELLAGLFREAIEREEVRERDPMSGPVAMRLGVG